MREGWSEGEGNKKRRIEGERGASVRKSLRQGDGRSVIERGVRGVRGSDQNREQQRNRGEELLMEGGRNRWVI